MFNLLYVFMLSIGYMNSLNSCPSNESFDSNIVEINESIPTKSLYKSDTCGIMSIDELANSYYYNQLLSTARTYVAANGDDTLTNHWSHASNCSFAVSDWDHIGNPITGSDDFLLRYNEDSTDHTLYCISYNFISANNWDVYGFYLNKVTYGDTFMYYAYGIRYNYTGSDIKQFPMTPFFTNSYIHRGLNVYIYHYYVQSSDFAIVNPFYTALFNDSTEPTTLGDAYNDGYDTGYRSGRTDGYNSGYQSGYNVGYETGVSTDTTASTIFTGILDVALIPVNVFMTIFNFEVFGINIAGIVSALLTVSVVIIVFRFVFGGKKDD